MDRCLLNENTTQRIFLFKNRYREYKINNDDLLFNDYLSTDF